MESKMNYSLSHYFDELKKRQQTKSQKGMTKEVSISHGIELLKALKEAQDQTLTLIALARRVNLRVGSCEEICYELKEEGLIEIERDEIGNDRISLTDRGRELI
jgi:predicted transcriptional regulator